MFNQTKGLLQFLPRTEDSWVSLQLNYENFKLKCQHFFDMERKAIDAGEVDIEMADAYVSES